MDSVRSLAWNPASDSIIAGTITGVIFEWHYKDKGSMPKQID